MDEYSKTLVVTEGDGIPDLESLRLYVKAIYHDPEFAPEIEAIVLYLANHKDLLSRPDAVFALLQQYFAEQLNKSPVWSAHVLKGMQILAAHIQDTIENRNAYLTQGKLNPNAVFWPNPTSPKEPRDLFDELPFAETYGFIDKSTPIGSAGSCFAMEIAHRFQANGYNYVIEQHHTAEPQTNTNYADASAAWGIIFNIPALRQLIEKSFGKRKLPKLLWRIGRDGRTLFRDPFREDIEFNSIEEYEAEYETHLAACRKVFLNCQTFIMTLGLNEIWTLKSDGAIFSRCPWNFSAALTERKVLTVQENINELQNMLDLWRSYNPSLKLILTVSPIPLHGTFRGHKHHIVAANCHSKAVLRVAAEEFIAKNKDVFYFPSYETVMYCTRNAWQKDQRHVSRETVDGVMRLFGRMFIRDKGETFSMTRV